MGQKRRKILGESGEPRFDGEIGGFHPFAGIDFLSIDGLNTRNLEASVGTDNREAVWLNGSNLSELTSDAFGVFRRQRLGVKDFQLFAVERGPGARRRIAASDQSVDLFPRLAPVDLGIFGSTAALVCSLAFVLLDARSLARLHQIDGFKHGVDT